MKIAIAGFGVEGQANYRYWRERFPEAEITVADEQPIATDLLDDHVATIIGESAFWHLNGFDLVVRTAGLAPRKIRTDGKVWSATNEFFDRCPAPIIGVTGSKGKGTTASLIASIAKADKRKVWLVGNIGLPSIEVLDSIAADDLVVYELSSFQLWDAVKSPATAVVLYIEQEHLDVHDDMNDYVSAKANIARHQQVGDRLIYLQTNEYSRRIADQSPAKLIGFPDEAGFHVADGKFRFGEEELAGVDSLRLPGEHNQLNALAAIAAIYPLLHDKSVIPSGLSRFRGLAHRLQYVATIDEIEYYDDSIATTPSSAIAALRAFDDNRSKIIILGGSSKGSDFSGLAEELLRQPDARALLVGAEANRIAEACDAVGFVNYEILVDQTMTSVVARAAELSRAGGVVLLSPAAASFGSYKNYIDRGLQYIEAVRALGR